MKIKGVLFPTLQEFYDFCLLEGIKNEDYIFSLYTFMEKNYKGNVAVAYSWQDYSRYIMYCEQRKTSSVNIKNEKVNETLRRILMLQNTINEINKRKKN